MDCSGSGLILILGAQVNGKLRGTVELQVEAKQQEAEDAARQLPSVAKFLEGQDIKKVIFVPGRILNFIAPQQKKKK